jgi:hypothetical protein
LTPLLLRKTKKFSSQVELNIVCRIGDEEEKCYLRTCQECGGMKLDLFTCILKI